MVDEKLTKFIARNRKQILLDKDTGLTVTIRKLTPASLFKLGFFNYEDNENESDSKRKLKQFEFSQELILAGVISPKIVNGDIRDVKEGELHIEELSPEQTKLIIDEITSFSALVGGVPAEQFSQEQKVSADAGKAS